MSVKLLLLVALFLLVENSQAQYECYGGHLIHLPTNSVQRYFCAHFFGHHPYGWGHGFPHGYGGYGGWGHGYGGWGHGYGGWGHGYGGWPYGKKKR